MGWRTEVELRLPVVDESGVIRRRVENGSLKRNVVEERKPKKLIKAQKHLVQSIRRLNRIAADECFAIRKFVKDVRDKHAIVTLTQYSNRRVDIVLTEREVI